jgi:CRP/FNR family cyclic AMP-dependent transcriptional regulator
MTAVPSMGLDAMRYLVTVQAGRTSRDYARHENVFTQGKAANSVFYVESGSVALTVLSARGKNAVVGVVGSGSFFGEGCLAGQALRMSTARTTLPCRISRVMKQTMLRLLHRERGFAAFFMAHLLAYNAQIEGDLAERLLNGEKRLAQLLLRLSKFGKGKTLTAIPRFSAETLASMIGSTPRKVRDFMQRFRTLGFIEDGRAGLRVHCDLLAVVLRDRI